jgi:hypothetical protein
MATGSPFLKLTIDPGKDFDALRRVYKPGQMADRMAGGIRRGIDRANLIVVGRIKRSRFTGVGPFPVSQQKLGHRSRRLIRSLDASRAEVINADRLSVESGIGSNVKYYGGHEFGFDGQVSVPAHTREMPETSRVSSAGRAYTVAAHTQKVRAHSRRMRVPERRPLRAGLAEPQNQETYQDEIYTGMRDALTPDTGAGGLGPALT